MSFTLELLYLGLKCVCVGLHLCNALGFGLLCGVVGGVLALDLGGARRGGFSLHLLDLSGVGRCGTLISAVIGDKVDAS